MLESRAVSCDEDEKGRVGAYEVKRKYSYDGGCGLKDS